MVNLRSTFSRVIPACVVTLSLVFLPLAALAEEPSVCVTPPASTSFHYPSGASSGTFIYNCDSGLFENAHYTYDPTTSTRTAKDPVVYTCDPATRTYNYTTWSYNAPSNSYAPYTENVVQPPAGASIIACPPLPAADPSPAAHPTANADNPTSSLSTNASLNNPSSGSTLNNSLNNTASLDNTTGVTFDNVLRSNAISGNVMLLGNTTAGDASTGNADVLAMQMNILQSSVNFGLDGEPITFLVNIDGDVNGDFLLDPATLSAVQPTTANTDLSNKLILNNTTDATLNTDLKLNATSGNAMVDANTTAGEVTTGNANAVADVVNIINSVISAGRSFMGIININGNLNGDILLPPNFVDQLIAANVPTVTITAPGSMNSNSTDINDTATVNNVNTQGITNNIHTAAASGNANVSKNTTAGDVNTGAAATSITAFNLTGNTVIGSNALLVFVNTPGQWVGLIVNAPAGATAAGLGGGLTQNATVNNTAKLNNDTNQQINNNIDVSARSGDATATRNTTVGNVRTGDAKTAVSVGNIANSNLSLKGWFGLLFINVWGTWHGSFGINTSAGDPIPAVAGRGGGSDTAQAQVVPAVFNFVPNTDDSHSGSFTPFTAAASTTPVNNGTGSPVNAVLAANTTPGSAADAAQLSGPHGNFARTAAIIGGFTVLTIIGDALYSRRRGTKA